jgi:hypothetical protein
MKSEAGRGTSSDTISAKELRELKKLTDQIEKSDAKRLGIADRIGALAQRSAAQADQTTQTQTRAA